MVIADLKNKVLKVLGFSGAVQDQEFKLFKSEGVSSKTYPEAFMEWLSGLGFGRGSLQDRLKEYLSFLGFTGAIQDAEEKALANGIFYDTIPLRVKNILSKYNATLLLPGPAGTVSYWFQPNNYRESTGQTLAAADQQVGLVVDAARVPGPELIQVLNFASSSQWDMTNTASFTANTWSMGSSGGPMLVTVPGKTYSVSFPWSATAYGTFALYNGTGIGAPVVAQQSGTSGTLTLIFTAAANRAYFRFSAGGTVAAGAISVRELPGILASQSTSGFQPYLRQSGGVNSWQFDGVDDRLSLSAVPFQMADDHFVVVGAQSPAIRDMFIFNIRNSANPAQIVAGIRFTATANIEAYYRNNDSVMAVPTVIGGAAINIPMTISVIAQGSALTLRKDSIAGVPVTKPGGFTSVDNATIGASLTTTSTQFWNGHIHGVVFGKGAILPAELLILEKFIAKLQGRSL